MKMTNTLGWVIYALVCLMTLFFVSVFAYFFWGLSGVIAGVIVHERGGVAVPVEITALRVSVTLLIVHAGVRPVTDSVWRLAQGKGPQW